MNQKNSEKSKHNPVSIFQKISQLVGIVKKYSIYKAAEALLKHKPEKSVYVGR